MVDRFVPLAPRPTVGALLAPWRIATLAHRHDPATGRMTRFVDFLDRVHTPCGPESEDHAVAPAQDNAEAGARLDQADRRPADRLPSPALGLALARLFLALRLLGRSALFADLIISPTRPPTATAPLEALAAVARENQGLHKALHTLDTEELSSFPSSRRSSTPTSPNTATGRRGPRSWSRRPLRRGARDRARVDQACSPLPPRLPSDPDHALSELVKHPPLRGPRRRARGAMFQAARAGIAFREDSHLLPEAPPYPPEVVAGDGSAAMRRGGARCAGGRVPSTAQRARGRRSRPTHRIREGRAREAVRSRSARREELNGVRLIDQPQFPRRETGDVSHHGHARK